LLEPDARKRARPVLRGAGRSNAPGLPGHARAADQDHAASTPGTAWPGTRDPARLVSEDEAGPPILMPSKPFRRLNNARPTQNKGRTLLERLPDPHLTGSSPAFSPNAHHDGLQPTQHRGGLTPTPAGPTPEGQQASISRTAPLYGVLPTSTSSNVRDTRFPATTRRSAPAPRIATLPLAVSAARSSRSRQPAAGHHRSTGRPPHRGAGSHVPHKSPSQARAASMPDAVWPVGRHPPDSSRDRKEPPVSTSSISFRHFISGLLSFAFLARTWRTHGTPFPTTLTTTVS